MYKTSNNLVKIYTYILLLLVLFLLIEFNVSSEFGNYCTTSPCTCGSACQNGGNEVSNGYNTINSCKDGPEDSFEYVHDITVTDLNGSTFIGGHVIEVDGVVNCDSDGDEVSFAYYNGSAWISFFDVLCGIDANVHYYQNLTLDDIEGNHTIRVTLAYSGTTGMVCAHDYDNVYSDTDDISFYVESSGDNTKPSVFNISPQPQTFFYIGNLSINISANVTDDISVANVSANITWGAKSELVQLTNTFDDLYEGNFTNTSDITRYDLVIYAYDTNGNLNDSITSYFFINATTNVTINFPVQGVLYPYLDSNIEFELSSGPDVYITWIDVNGNIAYGLNKKISFETSGYMFENNYENSNLSQSFIMSQDTFVNTVSLKLRKNGTGVNNSRIEIRNSTNSQASSVLAYADVNQSLLSTTSLWINFSLNQTIFLAVNNSYWLFLSENGSSSDHYEWEANFDQYSGNYSNNASKDLLFKILDKYRFNQSYSPTAASMYFQAFANTSQGQSSSAIVVSNFDTTLPSISTYNITPTDLFSLDPYTTINVTASVTDNLEIQNVDLQYVLQNETTWLNITMQNVSGLHQGNFSLSSESNITLRIYAEDTSFHSQISSNSSLSIFYDWNWSIIPEQFNATGVLINNNVTIGNLSIYSYADYALSFNITASSDREVYINGSNSRIIPITSNSNATVIITATGAATPQENPISINIVVLNESANPSSRQNNFTLASFLSGPYLVVDIVDYDSTVTQGNHINTIKAKIINVGNQTATNLLATWTLPSDWTTRSNLTANYTSLYSGGLEIWEFEINADIPNDASTGEKSILITINSTENVTASDSRTVTVSSASSPTIINTGGGSSSVTTTTVTSPPIVIKPDDLHINISEINVPKNELFVLPFTVYNNVSNKIYYNLTFEIDGLFRSYYNITPEKISTLKKDSSIKLFLKFNLPDYFPEGISELDFVIRTGSVEIRKPIKLVVFDRALSLTECLNVSRQLISKLQSGGINTDQLDLDYLKAEKKLIENDFLFVRAFCKSTNLFYQQYLKQKNAIDDITGQIVNYQSQGYDTEELEDFISLVKAALHSGNLDKSGELIAQAQILLQTTAVLEKPFKFKFLDYIILNKSFLLTILILSPIFLFLTNKLIYITKTETRIQELEKEKTKIITMLKDMQDYFFNKHFVNKSLYQDYLDNYKKRLGEIEIHLLKLKFKKAHYIKPSTSYRELENQKKEIQNLIKAAQQDYYVKKIIDFESFEQVEEFYTSVLTEIEEKLNLSEKPSLTEKPNIEKEIQTSKSQDSIFDKEIQDKFYLANGTIINSLKDLYEQLNIMDDSTFNHHVNYDKNDFANWIKNVFKEEELAFKILKILSKSECKKLIGDYFKLGDKD